MYARVITVPYRPMAYLNCFLHVEVCCPGIGLYRTATLVSVLTCLVYAVQVAYNCLVASMCSHALTAGDIS